MNRRRIFIVFGVLVVVVSMIFISIMILQITTPPANSWAFSLTQIDRLRSLGYDGSGVIIGVIDTGVDCSHSDFQPSSFLAWNDTISAQESCYDDCDHGTHLVGMLIGHGSLSGILTRVDVDGIAPGAQCVVVKAVSKNDCMYGGGNDEAIAAGIQYCIDHDADIICLSLGKNPEKLLQTNHSLTQEMCTTAVEHGIFLVAAAGNDGQHDDGDVAFPAQLESVISVGTISKAMAIASFSSQGHQHLTVNDPDKKPELVAPGVDLFSTRISNAYGLMSGTSQSATVVTGALALLLDAYPEYQQGHSKNTGSETVHFIKEIMVQTARKIGNLENQPVLYSHDDHYGYGLLQIYDAYEALGTY